MARTGIARALSIVGHPALLVPASVMGAAAGSQAPPQLLWGAAAASVFVAVGVGVYSLVQVRAGRWTHIDASLPQERSQLNIFLVLVLFGLVAMLWWGRQPRPLFVGAAAAGCLVVVAHLLRGRLKVSLHAAFAVFVTSLLWPHAVAVLLGLVLAAGVAWSRLVLGRHTPIEVATGLLAGAATGAGLRLVAF